MYHYAACTSRARKVAVLNDSGKSSVWVVSAMLVLSPSSSSVSRVILLCIYTQVLKKLRINCADQRSA